eukprot:gene17922-24315_t
MILELGRRADTGGPQVSAALMLTALHESPPSSPSGGPRPPAQGSPGPRGGAASKTRGQGLLPLGAAPPLPKATKLAVVPLDAQVLKALQSDGEILKGMVVKEVQAVKSSVAQMEALAGVSSETRQLKVLKALQRNCETLKGMVVKEVQAAKSAVAQMEALAGVLSETR